MSYPGPGESEDPQESRQPRGQPSAGSGERYHPPDPYGQPGPYQQPGQYEQPGYQTQYGSYGQPGYYGRPGQPAGVNVLAILTLVFAFVFAPAGIVLGHLARRQISRTGEQGAQLATWGLVLSYIFTALYVLGCCGWLALASWAGAEGDGGAY